MHAHTRRASKQPTAAAVQTGAPHVTRVNYSLAVAALRHPRPQARFKGTKFEVRPEEAAALEAELGGLAAPELRAQLFGKDFKAHCRAADMLRDGLPGCFDEVRRVRTGLLLLP